MKLYEKLMCVQSELKAPKNQFNKFGNYAYRSCEDIQEAVKPLLHKHKLALKVSDEILLVGERYYIKATASVIDTESGEKESTTAYAREEETKKGMDSSQITGSASSYARKYALNGLLCIDDAKDSDSTNKHGKDEQQKLSDAQVKRLFAIASKSGYSTEDVKRIILKKYKLTDVSELSKAQYDEACEGFGNPKK